VVAYFDTSALLKLIIAEHGADQAILLWQQASEVVLSRLAWPEAIAALAAARRGRRVSDAGYQTAADGLRLCFERCTMVSIADSLVDRAADLAAGYDLRAADAIHLATAQAVMEADSLAFPQDQRRGVCRSRS
jgi:uncharacterized protein